MFINENVTKLIPSKKIMPPLRKFSLESKTPRHILSSLSTFTNVDLVTKDQKNLIIEQEAEYNESFDDHKSLVKKNQFDVIIAKVKDMHFRLQQHKFPLSETL